MTCQINALLKDKAVTAADGAVTVNKTKAWNTVEKTFKLCETPPMNIMINGSPTINNFPVKLLINEFEKIVKNDNIEDITEEFLDFIGKTVPKTDVDNFINDKIEKFSSIYGIIDEDNYEMFLELNENFNLDIPEFIGNKYDFKFKEIIGINLPNFDEKELLISLKKIFCHYLISESTGIVITGISANDHFPSSISLNIILNNEGKMEIMNKNIEINCKRPKFGVFGQNDVVNSYFTGIDEDFEIKLYHIIKNIFNPTDEQLRLFNQEINRLKLINEKELLKNVNSLPDDDLYTMMEILIKSTELKRKLLSNVDSVGGNVHIEKITKTNGIETKEKIYKEIKTIKR